MWELTTLSFVVDWLVSIGPWLGTLRVNPACEILGNTVGVKVESEFTIKNLRGAYNSDNATYSNIEGGTGMNLTLVQYKRSKDLQLSYLPHFTWGRTLDLFKAIDAISLIWQFLPKLIKGRK